ncbi:stomatin [Zootoca vivipara]|uniref:stomatin n=1 Tax=Zootoca vivipara TaxID=8524 RepID=UPI00293BF3C4|nr:stomatin [Zootoca vivipara]
MKQPRPQSLITRTWASNKSNRRIERCWSNRCRPVLEPSRTVQESCCRLVRAELVKSVAFMTEGAKDDSQKTEVVYVPPPPPEKPGQDLHACEWLLVILSFIIVLLTFPLSIWLCVEVVYEYEQAIIVRLGRIQKGGAKGPGIHFLLPCTDTLIRVDMRTKSFTIQFQEVFTKDPMHVDADGVIYFRVQNPMLAVTSTTEAVLATQLLAETTFKNVLGTKTLSEIISNREQIAYSIQTILNNATGDWGIKVERVELNDVKARVKVIVGESEKTSPKIVKESSVLMIESPKSLKFRCMQTEKTTTTTSEDASTTNQQTVISQQTVVFR